MADRAQKPETAHAVVFPWPGQGHINPMMELSRRLVRRGVEVTFVSTQRCIDSMQEQGGESRSRMRMVGLADGLSEGERRNIGRVDEALVRMEAPLLQALADGPPVSCIIADFFVPCALPVARALGLPLFAFWTQSAASLAAHVLLTRPYHPPPQDTLVANKEVKECITCIPGCPPLRLEDVPTFLQPFNLSDHMFSRIVTVYQKEIHEFAAILLNTFEGLENASLSYLDNSCLDWLDAQKDCSVVYVSFGSMVLLPMQQIDELVEGLKESEYPFLFVLDPTIFPKGGDSNLDKGTKTSKFVSWAPQLEVLSHRSIGGFVTHCGWNSILESVCKGCPMLCWPYFADQMMNCKLLVESWGIGVQFEKSGGFVYREEIKKKVETLMDFEKSKGIRERIIDFQLAAQNSVKQGGNSCQNFESFLNIVKG